MTRRDSKLSNVSSTRPLTLSEARGRIDHLESELKSIIDLLGDGQDRSKLLIARIDSAGQTLRDGNLTRKGAARMIMDLLPKAREMRGSLGGIKERCEIALKGEVVE